MKKVNYLLTGVAFLAITSLTSCSKDDDTAELCAECHIALPDKSETIWDIASPSGDEDFCGDELTEVEASDATYTVTDTLYADGTGEILLPGEYGPGSANSQYEIHCEDHGEHEHPE